MTPIPHSQTLEVLVKEFTVALRSFLEVAGETRFSFEIVVSGQVTTGDASIEYTIREGTYSEPVKGGTINAIVEEHLRRKGWKAVNQALCLPRVPDRADNETIEAVVPPPSTKCAD